MPDYWSEDELRDHWPIAPGWVDEQAAETRVADEERSGVHPSGKGPASRWIEMMGVPRPSEERCELSAGKERCPAIATTAIIENNEIAARVCDLCIGAAMYIVGRQDTRLVPLRVWNRAQRLERKD